MHLLALYRDQKPLSQDQFLSKALPLRDEHPTTTLSRACREPIYSANDATFSLQAQLIRFQIKSRRIFSASVRPVSGSPTALRSVPFTSSSVIVASVFEMAGERLPRTHDAGKRTIEMELGGLSAYEVPLETSLGQQRLPQTSGQGSP